MIFENYSPKKIIEGYHESKTIDNIILRKPSIGSSCKIQKGNIKEMYQK